MALPRGKEARLFYQSAVQRLEDARFLLESERTTGAVYLAGYGVECILKALLLTQMPHGKRAETMASFRGTRAHDYDWLKQQYLAYGGPSIPLTMTKHLTFVSTWTTDLRYQASMIEVRDAEEFIQATRAILRWAQGRL